MTPQQIIQSIPNQWNVDPIFPDGPEGTHYPGLVIVDGVTVAYPLMDALHMGLVDVPLILQNVAHETDLFPDNTVFGYNSSQYQQWLDTSLSPFGPTASEVISSVYKDDIAVNGEYAYTSMTTDFGVTCAMIELASYTGFGFLSPVYVTYVNYSLNTPFPSPSPDGSPLHYAFHIMDYIFAAKAWDFFGTSNTTANNYSPDALDLMFGDTIRSSWRQLALTQLVKGWVPFSSTSGFPEHYVVNVLSAKRPEIVMDFKAEQCRAWKNIGFGPQEWWVN